MFLIGQYDSPFVRRVAIAMRLYGIAFEHRPWSTFGDGDKIAPYNPLRRVPTLVLDSGEALIESTAIIDYLDEMAHDQDKVTGEAMLPSRGAERRRQLRLCALATGLGDKSVSLVYESVLRKEQLKLWVERCEAQVSGALDVLERHGYPLEALIERRFDPRFGAAMKEAVEVSRSLFLKGLPLAGMVDRRLAIDLDLFSRGGMHVLKKIEQQNYDVLGRRPAISKLERVGLLLASVARMTLGRAA